MPASNILVLNCGSSSLKFAVIAPQDKHSLIQGLAERLGSNQATLSYEFNNEKHTIPLSQGDHQDAIGSVVERLKRLNFIESLSGVGHRVVHGGETFSHSQIINQQNLETLKQLSHLAPLHNPVNVLGIEILLKLLPQLTQVAVFDTAFHQSLPEPAFLYALPYELYQQHSVRRYGFHGTSYRYVSQEAARRLNKNLDESHFLIAHLGNGCSACASKMGQAGIPLWDLLPLKD